MKNSSNRTQPAAQSLSSAIDRSRRPAGSSSGRRDGGRPAGSDPNYSQLHPLVPPQVSHLRQVPLRTRVKLPHSVQLSPSTLSPASERQSSASLPLDTRFQFVWRHRPCVTASYGGI